MFRSLGTTGPALGRLEELTAEGWAAGDTSVDLLTGSTVGPYRLECLLGRGGMGAGESEPTVAATLNNLAGVLRDRGWRQPRLLELYRELGL